jgi:hypothetical protein
MKSVSWPKPGYASISCSTISNIPYNLIFTTKFNDSSILITIISCDYLICRWRMNTGDVTIQPRLSSITKIFSRRISQSDWNIQIKLYKYNIVNLLYIQYEPLSIIWIFLNWVNDYQYHQAFPEAVNYWSVWCQRHWCYRKKQ